MGQLWATSATEQQSKAVLTTTCTKSEEQTYSCKCLRSGRKGPGRWPVVKLLLCKHGDQSLGSRHLAEGRQRPTCNPSALKVEEEEGPLEAGDPVCLHVPHRRAPGSGKDPDSVMSGDWSRKTTNVNLWPPHARTHTCMCTYTHAHTHASMHTHKHVHPYTCAHTHYHACTHISHVPMCMCPRVLTCMHSQHPHNIHTQSTESKRAQRERERERGERWEGGRR